MRDFLSGIARFGPGIQNSHAARVPGASQETSKQTSRGYPAPGPKSDRLLGDHYRGGASEKVAGRIAPFRWVAALRAVFNAAWFASSTRWG